MGQEVRAPRSLPAGFLPGQHRFLSAAARQPDPYLHRPSILWPLRQGVRGRKPGCRGAGKGRVGPGATHFLLEVPTTTPPRLLRPNWTSGNCFLTWTDTPDHTARSPKLWKLLQGKKAALNIKECLWLYSAFVSSFIHSLAGIH